MAGERLGTSKNSILRRFVSEWGPPPHAPAPGGGGGVFVKVVKGAKSSKKHSSY
jgi:hypothetical protein